MTDAPWRCGHCYRTAAHCQRRGSSPVCRRCYDELAGKGRKFCTVCCMVKPLEAFDRIGSGDARRAVCRDCRRPATRAARQQYLQSLTPGRRAQNVAYTRAWRARRGQVFRFYCVMWRIGYKMRASAKLRTLREAKHGD